MLANKSIIILVILNLQTFAAEKNIPNTPPHSPTKEITSVFSLPDDFTQWQKITTQYMKPLLSTQVLKNAWQELLDLTMPSHDKFVPQDKKRREKTIIDSYNKLSLLDSAERLQLLKALLERHKNYLKK